MPDDEMQQDNVVDLFSRSKRVEKTPEQKESSQRAAFERITSSIKLNVFRALIDEGETLVVVRNLGFNGLVIPDVAKSDGDHICLKFSSRYGAGDFDYDERGVRSTLTFDGKPWFCDVPWIAVVGMMSKSGGSMRWDSP
jgi:hypothetical protein